MADAENKKKSESEQEIGEEGEDFDRDGDHLYEDWDELASDPEEASRLSRALEGILPDIIKRGAGALVAENGIRSLVTDRGVPREAVGFIMGQVDATKREVVRMVSREVRMFLENVDLGGELTKILTSISFEVRTEVRFIPNDAAVKPNIRNRVRVRGRREDGDEEAEEAPPPQEGDKEKFDVDEEKSRGRARRRRWPLGRGHSTDEGDSKKVDPGEGEAESSED